MTNAVIGKVGPADIARLAGVKPATVSNWRKRYEDFPKPVDGTEARPLFSIEEVTMWLTGRGIEVASDATDSTPEELVEVLLALFRGTQVSYDSAIRALIALCGWEFVERNSAYFQENSSFLSDPFRRPADPDEVLSSQAGKFPLVLRLWSTIGNGPKSATEVGEFISRQLGSSSTVLSQAPQVILKVREEIAHASDLEGLVEALANRHGDRRSADRELTTLPGVSKLLASVAHTGSATAAVLASGVGQVCKGLVDAGIQKLRGWDINQDAVGIASSRALIGGWPAEFSVQDLLRERLGSPSFDSVICDAPFGVQVEKGALDPMNWQYGVPGSRADWLWPQLTVSQLSAKGRGVVLLSKAAWTTTRGAELKIREHLLRDGRVEAVIELPPNTHALTSIGTVLLVLRGQEVVSLENQEQYKNSVLMVNLEHETQSNRQGQDVSDAAIEKAIKALEQFRETGQSDVDSTVAVATTELLGANAKLAPSAWQVAAQFGSPLELIERVNREALSLAQWTSQPLGEIEELNDSLRSMSETGRLGEGGSQNSLRALGLEVERVRPFGRNPEDEESVRISAITAKSAKFGETEPTEVPENAAEALPIVHAGDILLLPNQTGANVVVWQGEDAPFTSSLWWVVRTSRSTLDPYFVAASLQASAEVAMLSSGATIPRINPVALTVPSATVEQQRTLGSALHRLAQVEADARRAVQASSELKRSLTALINARLLPEVGDQSSHEDGKTSET